MAILDYVGDSNGVIYATISSGIGSRRLYFQHYINNELTEDEKYDTEELINSDDVTIVGTRNTGYADYTYYAINTFPTFENLYAICYQGYTNRELNLYVITYDMYNQTIPINIESSDVTVVDIIETATVEDYKYQIAPNQYNLDNSNQLLPDVKAYGKNGNITGDESAYDNIGYDTMFSYVSGADIKLLGEKYAFLDLDHSVFKDKKPMIITSGTKQMLKYYQTQFNTKGDTSVLCNPNSIIHLDITDVANDIYSFKYYNININKETVLDTVDVNQYHYNEALIQVNENLAYIAICDAENSVTKLYEFKNDELTLVGSGSIDYSGGNHYPAIMYLKDKLYLIYEDGEDSKNLIVYVYKNSELIKLQEIPISNDTHTDYRFMISSGDYVYYIIGRPYYNDEGNHIIVSICSSNDSINHYITTNEYMFPTSSMYLAKSLGDNVYVSTERSSSDDYTLTMITPTNIEIIGSYKYTFPFSGVYNSDTNIITCQNGLYKGCYQNIVTGEQHLTRDFSDSNNGLYFEFGKEVVTIGTSNGHYDYHRSGGDYCVILGDTFVIPNLVPNKTGGHQYLGAIYSILSNVDVIDDTVLQNPILRISDTVAIQYGRNNYDNTLTPEEYLQALQTAKEIKGNKRSISDIVVNNSITRKTNQIT